MRSYYLNDLKLTTELSWVAGNTHAKVETDQIKCVKTGEERT